MLLAISLSLPGGSRDSGVWRPCASAGVILHSRSMSSSGHGP